MVNAILDSNPYKPSKLLILTLIWQAQIRMETVQADEAAFRDSFPQQGYFSKVDASEEQMLCLDGL